MDIEVIEDGTAPGNGGGITPGHTVITPGHTVVGSDRIDGEPCTAADLPANATYGVYITFGVKKWDCLDKTKSKTVKCSCAARECKSPYVIARNSAGESQGYCTMGH